MPWSPRDLVQLDLLVAMNFKRAAIARRMGRSHRAVRTMITRRKKARAA